MFLTTFIERDANHSFKWNNIYQNIHANFGNGDISRI